MWIKVEISSGRIIKKEIDSYHFNRWNNELTADKDGTEILHVSNNSLVAYEIFTTWTEMEND